MSGPMVTMIILVLVLVVVLQSATLGVVVSRRRLRRATERIGDRMFEQGLPALPSEPIQTHDELLGDYQSVLRETLARVGDEGEGLADIGVRLNEHVNEITAVLRTELMHRISDLVEANGRLRGDLAAAQVRLEAQCAAMERLSAESRHDCLTHLPNRRAFDERLVELFGRYKRYGESFVMVLFDVDRFKSLNDTHGHAAGDAVLAAIGRVVAERRRSTDFVARVGGEEFAILLTNTTLRQAEQCIDGYRRTIASSTFEANDLVLPVTASFGAAEVLDGETSSRLKDRADEALYTAKAAGRNCARFHDGDEIVARMAETLAVA